MRLAAALLGLLWLLLPAGVAASEVNLDEYRALLSEVEADLQSAVDAPPERQEAAATAAAARLRSIDRVHFNGTTAAVHHPVLLAALEAQPPDLPRAALALERLRGVLDKPARPVDASTHLGSLHSILSRAEFESASGLGPLEPLIGPILYVRKAFLDGLAAIGGLFVQQERLGLILTASVAIGVVAAAAVFVWRSLRGSIVHDAASRIRVGASSRPRSHELWADGQARAAQGDGRGAIHAFFLSAALYLDEIGLMRFNPGLTNREHLMRLDRGEARAALEPLVEQYDRLWYSRASFGNDELLRIRDLAEHVRALSR